MELIKGNDIISYLARARNPCSTCENNGVRISKWGKQVTPTCWNSFANYTITLLVVPNNCYAILYGIPCVHVDKFFLGSHDISYQSLSVRIQVRLRVICFIKISSTNQFRSDSQIRLYYMLTALKDMNFHWSKSYNLYNRYSITQKTNLIEHLWWKI